MFTIPKKDGGYRPIKNPKPLNRFLLYQLFKMEWLFMVQDLIERTVTFERCISNSPNQHKRSKVFKVPMETGAVPISGTSIRSGLCSKNLYKTYETSRSSSKKVRSKTHNLPRRHSYLIKAQIEIGFKSKHDLISLTDAWFYDKLWG